MNNLLPSTIEMHSKFDLKGSSYKRKASAHELTKTHPTYKDLDFLEFFPEGLFVESETHLALIKTIERDCRVLQSFKIMDYSMLIGMHQLKSQLCKLSPDSSTTGYKLKSNKVRMAQFSTALESIDAEADATNLEFMNTSLGGIPAVMQSGEKLVLYIGIIDILQSYRFAKKLEHTFKSFVIDGDTISVHRPGFYAQRFQSFFANRVFKKIPPTLRPVPSKKKSLTERQKLFAGEGLDYIDARSSKDILPYNSSPLPPYTISQNHARSLSSRTNRFDATSDVSVHSSDMSYTKSFTLKFEINLREKSNGKRDSNESFSDAQMVSTSLLQKQNSITLASY